MEQVATRQKGWVFGVLMGLLGQMAYVPVQGQTYTATQQTEEKSKSKSSTKQKKSKSDKTSKTSKTNKAVQVVPLGKTDPGWGESPEQRSARLARECKGRPNAGACEGYGG